MIELMVNASVQSVPIDSQPYIDLLTLEYHKRVAAKMAADPEHVIEKARSNLHRWLLAYDRGTPEAWCFEEWEELLNTLSVPELIAVITEDSDEGQRLRSSTPFVGLLSQEEKEEITRRYEKMELLMARAETIMETAYDGALVSRLERFENHLRSQPYINYNLTPIRELLARLKL